MERDKGGGSGNAYAAIRENASSHGVREPVERYAF